MTFYADMAATAHELLAEFGLAMTLARPSSSAPAYDPTTGEATPVSPGTYTVTGAKFDYIVSEIDGSSVLFGDQRVYLSTSGGVLPRPGDTLTIAGSVFRVMRVSELAPGGTAVIYDVQVRR